MRIQIAGLMVAAGLLTGCQAFKGSVATPIVTELPGQFTTQATVVDMGGGVFKTNYTTVPVTQTNWIVNSGTKAVVDTIGGLVPGYGTIASSLLGLLATGYVGWLNRRNKSIAVSTIQGVEQFREGLKASGDLGLKLDEKLVGSLKYVHAAAGLAEIAQKLVEASTKSSAPSTVADVSKVINGTKPVV